MKYNVPFFDLYLFCQCRIQKNDSLRLDKAVLMNCTLVQVGQQTQANQSILRFSNLYTNLINWRELPVMDIREQ